VRYFYNNNLTATYDEILFLVDDDFVPHWFIYGTDTAVGLSSKSPESLHIYSGTSHEQEEVALKNEPVWADYGLSPKTMITLYNDHEIYKNGFFASFGNVFGTHASTNLHYLEHKGRLIGFTDVKGIDNNIALIYQGIFDFKAQTITLHKTQGGAHALVHNSMLTSAGINAKVLTPSYEVKHLFNEREVWVAPLYSDYDFTTQLWSVVDAKDLRIAVSANSLEAAKAAYLSAIIVEK
jgi:hypothetical protein